MNPTRNRSFGSHLFAALAAVLLFGAGAAWAGVEYLSDGAVQNSYGGFDLPLQGSCTTDATKPTRPACLGLRIVAADSTACTAALGSWTTNGVCNDLVNNSMGACNAQPDRFWNAGTGICAVVMNDDDRNNVSCALHGATWVTAGTCVGVWTMPAGNAYTPPVLNWTSGPAGTGDQCLRCHNTRTQYNSPRVRDTEDTMFMGHKNMARKVTPGTPWGGPPFQCVGAAGDAEEECYDNGGNWVPEAPYPGTDTGQDIDWTAGTIDHDLNVGTPDVTLYWIYGDWLSALPRAIYSDAPDTAATPDKPKVSYSCARCHTTGWASSATYGIYGAGAAGSSTREPEKSFPGITWDGVTDAVTGHVNFASGVSGETGKMASFDQFGIQCSRCHGSAVNRTSTAANGFSAPTGMSTHHSDLTGPNVSTSGDKGYCTNPDFSTRAMCDSAGGAWLTQCSIAGVCSNPTFTTSGSCVAAAAVWTPYVDQTTCQNNGGAWQPNATCSLAGVCNTLNPAHNTQGLCEGAGGQWAAATDIIRCLDIHVYGRENDIPAYEAATFTGTKTNRGQIITNLCMNCHRQETAGLPYDATNPSTALKVGPYHSTVTFLSHPHGNQYLNSPHAKFTGTTAQIPTGKFKFDMSGEYKSFFMTEGEAANTGNGCTGCHDVHTSVVTGENPIHEECTECHAKNLGAMFHPAGKGTPLEEMGTEPMAACVTCHMPGGEHLFRINSDAAYSTFPMPAAITGTTNANTAPDGSMTSAVWVDIDQACGQCHGGGSAFAENTGSISAGSAVLAVGDATIFAANQRIKINGAGALYYDDEGQNKFNDDFETFVKSIDSPTQITLAGKATKTVAGAAVVQNPTRNGAGYMTKAQLATLAEGIHGDAPVASFTYTLGNPNTLQVSFSAAASTCGGSAANCDVFEWDFGDGDSGTGISPTHTYASSGTFAVTLTVEQYGVGTGTKTKNVTTYTADLPPVLAAGCSFNADTWLMTVTDNGSTDDHALTQGVVDWGDGSLKSSDLAPPFGPFTHTYAQAGSFVVTYKIADSVGQVASTTCFANPNTFSVGGVVHKLDDTTPVGGVTIKLWDGTKVVKTVYTDVAGNFLATNVKPGSYTLLVTKSGWSFPNPPAVVGPSNISLDIDALADGKVVKGGGKLNSSKATPKSN